MHRSGIVRVVAPLAATAVGGYFVSSPARMDICRSYPFDNKSLPLKVSSKTFPRTKTPRSPPPVFPDGSLLYLAGIGIQKQTVLFVLPVETCLLGLHLSETLMEKTRQCLQSGASLVDTLLNHRESPHKKGEDAKATIAVTMKFTTTVSRKQFLDLFREALPSKGSDEVFLSELSQFISNTGLVKGDQVTFVWYENEDKLMIRKQFLHGSSVMSLSSETLNVGELKRKLLARLLSQAPSTPSDTGGSFSHDLLDCVRQHINEIDIHR
jgi:hypothetical protein